MQNFKDLRVWQRSPDLVLDVYKNSKSFPKEEIYALTSQLRRAAASIPANISEGCGKYSLADFANYLQIALGSTNETEYFLLLVVSPLQIDGLFNLKQTKKQITTVVDCRLRTVD